MFEEGDDDSISSTSIHGTNVVPSNDVVGDASTSHLLETPKAPLAIQYNPSEIEKTPSPTPPLDDEVKSSTARELFTMNKNKRGTIFSIFFCSYF